MKKLSILLALALTFSLASCGEVTDRSVDTGNEDTDGAIESVNTTADETAAKEADTTAPEAIETYTAVLDNGTTVIVGGEADMFITTQGEPLNYMEAPSCIHEGFDKVYTFDGYSVTTSPAADKTQYIAELSLLSDAVALEGGLMIGGSASDAEAVFGTEYEEQFGVRKYTLEGATVSIVLDGDTVSGITISSTRS
ncbi:MAG: hypothetical protein IJ428_05715 [Clostridia bacterium]|nr:hypothetical protein [Clostridia bacterium]